MTNNRTVQNGGGLPVAGGCRWCGLVQVGAEIDHRTVGETLTSLLGDLLWVRTNSIAHRLPAQDFRGLMMAVPADRRRLLGPKAHAGERVLELSAKLACSRRDEKKKVLKRH